MAEYVTLCGKHLTGAPPLAWRRDFNHGSAAGMANAIHLQTGPGAHNSRNAFTMLIRAAHAAGMKPPTKPIPSAKSSVLTAIAGAHGREVVVQADDDLGGQRRRGGRRGRGGLGGGRGRRLGLAAAPQQGGGGGAGQQQAAGRVQERVHGQAR